MNTHSSLFDMECRGETMILTARCDLHELDYARIEAGESEVLEKFAETGARHVVLNLERATFFGSTALGVFVKLWKRATDRGGRMAVCGLSPEARQLMEQTRLSRLWPLCENCAAAMEHVEGD